MNSHTRISLFTFLFSLGIFSASCSDSRIDIYSNIKNTRELGEVLYLVKLNGQVVARSSYPSADTEKVFNYPCLVAFFAKTINGNIVKLRTYHCDRSGPLESVAYTEIEQIKESGLSPVTTSMIKLNAEAKEYIIVIHSILEKTGPRVLRESPKTMESITATHPLEIPDLMTLPKLEDDPDFVKINVLYDRLKKPDLK